MIDGASSRDVVCASLFLFPGAASAADPLDALAVVAVLVVGVGARWDSFSGGR